MSTKQSFDLESALPRLAGDWRLPVIIVLLAIVQQAVGHLNGDDSWFLTFAEKYRDGLQPYIDISDPNPPAAFLAYMPAVLTARLFAIAPEAVLTLFTFLGAVPAVLLTGSILRHAHLLRTGETVRALAAAAYVILFVPAFCFAEREHIALLAMLPMIAAGAARAAGAPIPRRYAVLAGLGCGIACAFKPYYLLPIAFLVIYGAVARRSVRLIFEPEILATAAVGALYTTGIFVFFPAYFTQALPLISDVYLPLRDSLWHILASPLFLTNAALLVALAMVSGFGKGDPRTRAFALASAGFLLTFLIQGKGWLNHAYPGVALGLLAAASFLSRRPAELDAASKGRRSFALFIVVPMLCVAPFLFGIVQDFGNREEYPGLTAAVRRFAPVHPKISALAEQLDVGHPLVRHLDGTWVGRQNCLWVSWGVRYLLARGIADPKDRRLLLAHMHQDERMFAEDVSRGKPDVLLVESPAVEAWARTQPALGGIFKDYRQMASAGQVGIWLRKPVADNRQVSMLR